MNVSKNSIKLERTIAAPVERVFKAWLDPRTLCKWLAPGDATVSDVQVDERVGGSFRLTQSRDGDAIGGFDAEILELVPNERIVLKWGLLGPQGLDGPMYDSLLTVTFRRDGNGVTTLTLLHEHLDALRAAMPDVADQFENGWNDVLDKLSAALTAI